MKQSAPRALVEARRQFGVRSDVQARLYSGLHAPRLIGLRPRRRRDHKPIWSAFSCFAGVAKRHDPLRRSGMLQPANRQLQHALYTRGHGNCCRTCLANSGSGDQARPQARQNSIRAKAAPVEPGPGSKHTPPQLRRPLKRRERDENSSQHPHLRDGV